VTQDHAVRRAGNIIFLANEVTEFGLNAEQRQHPIRDPQRLHLFRLAASIDRHVLGVPQADILEDASIVTVGEVGSGTLRKFSGAAESGRQMVESDQSVRRVERKGFQQHTVDHAEDGRRRADPQCEREDRHAREPGLLPEDARGVPQTLQERHGSDHAAVK